MIPRFKVYDKATNQIYDVISINSDAKATLYKCKVGWTYDCIIDGINYILLHVLELDGKEYVEGDLFTTFKNRSPGDTTHCLCFGKYFDANSQEREGWYSKTQDGFTSGNLTYSRNYIGNIYTQPELVGVN